MSVAQDITVLSVHPTHQNTHRNHLFPSAIVFGRETPVRLEKLPESFHNLEGYERGSVMVISVCGKPQPLVIREDQWTQYHKQYGKKTKVQWYAMVSENDLARLATGQ